MSFSSEVKGELEKQLGPERHCQIAELAAILHFCGRFAAAGDGGTRLAILTENASAARKCFTLLDKTFNMETLAGQRQMKPGIFDLNITEEKAMHGLIQELRLISRDGGLKELRCRVNPFLLKKPCCQRAFLRGVFLAVGSMSDPRKSYHLELVCTNGPQAGQLQELLQGFELDAKIVRRKKYHVVYLKEGSHIVDFLNIIEAHVALMKLENLRILKEMRNSINRRVNCEAANIAKTVGAAARQLEDIRYIRDFAGLESLPPNLKQMAEVRLEYPEATLQELGEYLEPALGKSGVNHRLRKLSEIADHDKEDKK